MNALVLLFASMIGAAPTDVQKLDKLVQIRQDVEALDQLMAESSIEEGNANFAAFTQGAIAYRHALLGEATKVSDGKVKTYEDLVRLTGAENRAPSAWEKAKGFLTFVNVMWFTGGAFIVMAFMWLFGHYFLTLILAVPERIWEVVLYGICGGLIYSGTRLDPDYALYPVLLGCLGLIGCVWLTHYIHFDGRAWKTSYGRYGRVENVNTVPMKTYQAFLTVAWAAVAIYFNSPVIGFMAVAMLMTFLGFMIGMWPGVIYTGFENDKVMPQATSSAGLILLVHVLLTALGKSPEYLAPFRDGMAFLGSFVYFLGLLIMSSDWTYKKWSGTYNMMQVVTVVSGVAALYIGNVYGIGFLCGVGGTLFYIYLLEKYYEIPWKGVGWAWSLLGLGGILYGFSVFAQTYPKFFIFM